MRLFISASTLLLVVTLLAGCDGDHPPPAALTSTPAPPTPTPTERSVSGGDCPALADVAGMLRRIGAPADTLNFWQLLPPNGWVLRGYPGTPFAITVPTDWVVDYDGTPGRARGGETTPSRSAFTVYCEEPNQ